MQLVAGAAVSILQPKNVTTPRDSVCVQPDNVPGPPDVGVSAVIDRVTVEESVVTAFPPASCTVTFGCVANATPPVELDGDWVTRAAWLYRR